MRKIKSLSAALIFFIAVIPAITFMIGCATPLKGRQATPGISQGLVKIKVTPSFDFRFDRMKPGVLQHLDRTYTYDVVPPELLNGLLFQGIHRAPMGTAIEIELLAPATLYFFFHHREDGGYTALFQNLENWQPCDAFPQYDIHNGDHGLKMVMYKIDARAGTYSIPPTTKDRACFSIVIQDKKP